MPDPPILLLLKRRGKMKHQSQHMLWLGILQAALALIFSITYKPEVHSLARIGSVKTDSTELLKADALRVLQAKCNICHKKQNPFMIFKTKNMEKRAPKINNMVFISGKMPKGDQYTLTQKEFDTLKYWINTLNLK